MTALGFNIHGYNIQNQGKLFDYLKNNQPKFVLVLNNDVLASQIADLGIRVILRITPDDEIQNRIGSFSEWWGSVKAKYTDKRLLVHFCNEPHSNLQKLSDLIVQGIGILDNEGRIGVFGNFGVGTPEPNDPNLAEAYTALKGTKHYLGVHEYWMYSVDQSMPYEITRYKNIPQGVKIVITEFGSDFIQDIYNQVKLQKFSGWKSYNNPAFVFAQTQRALAIYSIEDRVEGICFFCYGDSGGWDNYNAETFDILINNSEDFQMLTIKAKSGSVNRREQPNTTSPIHGTLTTATAVVQLAVSGDGWTQYRFTDGDYWLADAFVVIVPNKTIQIQLVGATDDDVIAFQQAIATITTLSNKYAVQFLDS